MTVESLAFRPPEDGRLTPIDEVVAALIEVCQPLAAVTLPVADAIGMALAEDAVAVAPVPPFDNSSMDGFAFRSADVANVPFTLTLRDVREAGDHVAGASLPAGHCDAIMTGAPLPLGADTVVPFERVAAHDEMHVRLAEEVAPGSSVRLAGDDIQAGAVALPVGSVVTPQALAALVACRVEKVSVHRLPRVAVLSTGREVVGTGDGSIPDSNSAYLLAALGKAGFEAIALPAVDDDEDALTTALENAAGLADAIITTGGVGPGARDLLPTCAAKLGDVARTTIAMKPGKPFAFGLLHGERQKVPLFALPGNPVSTMASFNVIVLPALLHMAGRPPLPWVPLAALEAFDRSADGKVHLVPAVISDQGVRRLPGGASHMVVSAATANCLVRVPDGDGARTGDVVDALFL